jgi:enediyne biosynthesis protein E4
MKQSSRGLRGLCTSALIGATALSSWGCGIAPPAGGLPLPVSTVAQVPVLNLPKIAPLDGFDFVYENGREAGHHAILESLGGGLGTFDYDGDGRWDLFCLGGGEYGPKDEESGLPAILGLPSALFRNLGDWKFEPVTDESGVGQAPFYSHGCCAADFNSDGFTDLLVTGYGGLQLFQNQGDGRFVEIHRRAGLLDDSWSTSAAWGDLDGDGHLDLYVAHYLDWSFAEGHNPPCHIYVGLGPSRDDVPEICAPKRFNPLPDVAYYSSCDGTFRDVSSQIGLQLAAGESGKGLGVVMGDIDLDGDLDIYVANDTDGNFLYLNQGRGVFDEVALLNGVAYDAEGKPEGSMGTDLGDFDGDGLPDIWVTNFEEESSSLYRNEGSGQFQHVSQGTGITALGKLYVGFGTVFADIDRDGDEDFVVSNGHVLNYPKGVPVRQEPLVLINQNGYFVKAEFPPGGYFSTPHRGRGLAMSDFDDDGDLDFAFSHNDGEPNVLVSNEVVNHNNWLRVRLIGTASNRDAIGAWLVLHTAAGDQLRLVKGGGSYLSQSDLRPFWGLPAGVEIRGLSIHWPTGKVQELSNVSANKTLLVIEPR